MCLGLALAACGGSQATDATQAPEAGADEAMADQADPATTFGPLGVGADWKSYYKANSQPVLSGDHGRRFVDTWVNEIGREAYLDPDEEAEIPVGTIVVKTSWERDGDQPSDTAGPIFVMEKRDPGYDPDNGDWYYAIHWENAPERFGGPFYWQSPSPKVEYCYKCHNGYDRGLGTVPEEYRN
ncbi:cytochrome P460 family protein [Haliangium sp.]|uniref:cytochrome P460 family protein n=1 Tax=Haliangium sp. TaxID=2663208 RepID=UPI003D14D152